MASDNNLRMMTLFITYIDHHFFNTFNLSSSKLKERITTVILNRANVQNKDILNSIIDYYYVRLDTYSTDHFFEILLQASSELLTYHQNKLCVDMFEQFSLDDTKNLTSLFNNKLLDFFEVNKLFFDLTLSAAYNAMYNYDVKYCIDNNLLQPISVVNHQLDSILSNGLAETHTHVAGSIQFSRQWDWLVKNILDDQTGAYDLLDKLEKNSHIKLQLHRLNCNYKLSHLIIYSIIIRLLMMIYLNESNIDSFDQYLKEVFIELDFDSLNLNNPYFILKESIEDIAIIFQYQLDEWEQLLKHLIYFFVGNEYSLENKEESCSYRIYSYFLIKMRDIINTGLYKEISKNLDLYLQHVEYIFQYSCFCYIGNKQCSSLFKQYFLLYIRLQNFIRSFIVESTDIKGFLEFHYFFKNQHIIYDMKSNMFDDLFQVYAYENVRYLEIRIGHVLLREMVFNRNNINIENLRSTKNIAEIEKQFFHTLRKFVESYLNYLDQLPNGLLAPQAGLILHFNKRYDEINKCWSNYMEISRDDRLIRYKAFQEECFLNLLVFLKIRNQIPYGEEYLVGIDGASNELLAEPWVLAPIFRSAKNRYISSLQKRDVEIIKNKETTLEKNSLPINRYETYHNSTLKRIKDLGVTYHVGEVFHSIISGLRHIDEVIDYFGFQNGERIGHGTVLGINIDTYVSNHPVAILPASELLDNLLWIHHLQSKNNLFKHVSTTAIEEKIWEVVHFIYNDKSGHLSAQIDLHHLFKAYQMQFDDLSNIVDINQNVTPCNDNFGSNDCIFKPNQPWDEQTLFLSRHCRCYLKKMTQMVQINVDNDLIKNIYKETQHYLLTKIAVRGIYVETNPVSNTNIGEFDNITTHPIFVMNNTYNERKNHVMVSISTDDPGTFSTTLRNQYGFIQQILYNKGIPMEEVLLWINRTRENGVHSTFLNKTPKNKVQIQEELKAILKYINEEVIK